MFLKLVRNIQGKITWWCGIWYGIWYHYGILLQFRIILQIKFSWNYCVSSHKPEIMQKSPSLVNGEHPLWRAINYLCDALTLLSRFPEIAINQMYNNSQSLQHWRSLQSTWREAGFSSFYHNVPYFIGGLWHCQCCFTTLAKT